MANRNQDIFLTVFPALDFRIEGIASGLSGRDIEPEDISNEYILRG